MHACPQSDTFYNKVTKKKKREKVRESCMFFPPITHLSPSSFIQDAHPTQSQFHQSIERLRVSRVSHCTRSRARFWSIGIATTSRRYRDGKRSVFNIAGIIGPNIKFSIIRCHGFRRKRIPWFNVAIRKSSH